MLDGWSGYRYRLSMMEIVKRPSLLMIRTGRREFREYLLRPISQQYRVHMFLGLAPTWELEYVEGTTVISNTLDTEAMIEQARRLHEQDPFDGVMTWDESRAPQAAAIAAALGLPGGDVDAIARCRDKHLTRQALSAAGVAQPRSAQVGSLEEAQAAAREFGFPVIVKPSDLALSIGVVRADSPEELAGHYAKTAAITVPELPDYQVRVLIEEFAVGEEISVDSAVFQGKVYPLCLARKELGFQPYCVEIGHHVDAGDPLLSDPVLLQLLADAHAALGFTDGVTHTEVMLTADGPKIIEVNGRLGGDLIPYLGLRATGVDTGLAAAAVATGRMPQVTHDRHLVAGIRFMHVDADDTLIQSIAFDEEAVPDSVGELVVLAKPGERRSTPLAAPMNCRIAYAVAVTDSVEECRVGLLGAKAALRVNPET